MRADLALVEFPGALELAHASPVPISPEDSVVDTVELHTAPIRQRYRLNISYSDPELILLNYLYDMTVL